MNLNLLDKVIIVSGGAKGIGAAIVKELINEKAIPVIIGRSVVTKDHLGDAAPDIHAIRVELGTAESCRGVVEEVLRVHGRIDGLVNNAGVNDGVGLEHGTPEKYLDSLLKNLHHYYYMAHYALTSLKKSKGSIVNVSSKVAITGQGHTSGYAAAKGAQLALTREWAAELLPYDIRVNAILPSEVMTPLYRKWLEKFDDPAAKENEIVEKIPLGKRMTKPEEIAAMTVFLLSDRSAHTTGQFLMVDGGYVHLDRALTK